MQHFNVVALCSVAHMLHTQTLLLHSVHVRHLTLMLAKAGKRQQSCTYVLFWDFDIKLSCEKGPQQHISVLGSLPSESILR